MSTEAEDNTIRLHVVAMVTQELHGEPATAAEVIDMITGQPLMHTVDLIRFMANALATNYTHTFGREEALARLRALALAAAAQTDTGA